MSEPLVKKPIAIVGMACRLPGADNLAEYWRLLAEGRDAVTDMPPDRLDRDLYYRAEKGLRGKTYSTRGGLISERPLDLARAGLTPEISREFDPCHQVLCGVAADALRHAGLDPLNLPAWRMGVYVGHSGGSPVGGDLAYGSLAEETVDYLRDVPAFAQLPSDVQDQVIFEVVSQLRTRRPARNEQGLPEAGAHAVASLIARALKLSGPQMAIDAACASSLVALALAAVALQQGEIEAAIVGGASFNKCDSLILFSHAQSCSATGSRPFDEAADGLISAEGYVALVIKTLDRAVADGDPIQAVIRGIGLSSDGRGRSLWAPRKEGQVQAMRRAYGPGVDPQRVGYVEAHATSTQVGDATEVEALREFFDSVASGRKIPIGSVKSNIGHTLETAGLAGLVKSVLAMQNGVVPPSINVQRLNRDIPWSDLPFFVARESLAWPRERPVQPRRAAVNAFGIGGLNVHVVIDEFDAAWNYASDRQRAPSDQASVTSTVGEESSEEIAIIGRGVILPGAFSIAALSELLDSGVSRLTEAPPKRWRRKIGVRPGIAKSGYCPTNRGGYIAGYEYDWRKFKIPPKQIDQANPLQFMLLDAARQALEEAGYAAKDFDHARTAVVVGSAFGAEFGNQLQVGLRLPEMSRDICALLTARGVSKEHAAQMVESLEAMILAAKPALLDETGSFTASTLASRISKTLDLMGGAMAIDASDCSSLAALDAACGLLRSHACSMVLCAGASRSMDLASFETLHLRGALERGQASASGFTEPHLPGEGVAMVLVKRLADARRDGDRILGIIRSVEARNLRVVKSGASSIYADPLLDQVGHLQGAQGIVSLVSALNTRALSEFTVRSVSDQGVEYCAGVVVGDVLPEKTASPEKSVQPEKTIVPERRLPMNQEGFAMPDQLVPSPASKFVANSLAGCKPRLIRLGARDWEQLRQRLNDAKQHAHELFYHPPQFAVSDQARIAIVVSDEVSLATKLDLALQQGATPAAKVALEEQGVFVQTSVSSQRRVAFLFPGQGSQYPDMLRGLTETSSAARDKMLEADGLLRHMTGESFASLAWGDATKLGHDVWATQAAMLVADIMLTAALAERGIVPDVVCGHSFGEFAALVAAGSWSLEQALRVTQIRSQAINGSRSGHGGLMSVDAPAERVAALIAQHGCRIYVTHYNAPQQTVVGGDDRSLAEFSALLVSEGLTPRQLPVPSAFHTPLLADSQESLGLALAAESLRPPGVPLLSSVTNRYVAEPEEIRANLVNQMVEPVRWMQLVQRLVKDGSTVLVEVGPQQVLTRLTRQVINGNQDIVLVATDHPKRSAEEMLLRVQAALETAGVTTGSSQDNRSPASALASSSMTEIEHFDATARRRERRRTGQTIQPAVSAAEKLLPVEQFDATSGRREARRATVSHSSKVAVASPSVSPSRFALEPIASQPISPVAVVQNVPQSHAASDSPPQLERFLIDFVVEQTGYPAEMIDLDWDMEADLGIDSIKRAQLFGELREFFEFEQPGKGGVSLDRFRTLRQVLGFLQGLPGKGIWLTSQPESASQHTASQNVEPKHSTNGHSIQPATTPAVERSSEELEKFLVDFVVEQTGYPPEIVELDVDLEADLGIDSIKKAQLFGELREHFALPLEQLGRLKLAEYRTLRQVLTVLESLQSRDGGDVGDHHSISASTPLVQPATSPMVDLAVSLDHSERGEMHAWLRDQVDEVWSPELEARLATLAPSAKLRLESQDEYQDLAQVAGLHISNVIAYRQHGATAKAKNGNGNGNGNGHTHSHAEHRMPADDAWSSIADLLAEDPKIASRYVLRMAEAPQPAGAPSQPQWHGAAVILGDNSYARAMQARFESEGRRAYLIVPSDDPLAAAAELERIWQREPACHLFITTPRDADAATSLDASAWNRRRVRGLMTPFWLCQKWLKLTMEAGLMEQASLAVATSLSGDMGFSGNLVAAESGAICGLLKAIFIESWVNGYRTIAIKAIDTPAIASPEEVTEATWRELAVPTYDIEVAWVNGRRSIVQAIKASASCDNRVARAVTPIRRGGVWVCTGGARGITAYVVKELAQRFDVRLHLLGTAPVPNIPSVWRNLSDDGLKALKLQVMQQARSAGSNPIKTWQDTEKLLEIDRTLAEFKAAGLTATYHSCDVADREALAAVLDRIRATDGPIEGILHGAGVGKDSRFDRKDPEKVNQCFRAKVDGALALMDLTRRDPVKHFVAFGSISGRFGANGHTDYSAANDMLCRLVGWYRHQRPEVHAVAFHWHAWGDVGMATKAETRLALEMIDMQFMPAREGMTHLFRELAAGTPEGEVLITDERYHRMFFPFETLKLHGNVRSFPLFTGSRSIEQGARLVSEIDLDPTKEPFLIGHRLEDRPLLPVVIGMEFLAEAASKQAGGGRVVALHNVEALNGLRFFTDRPQAIRVAAVPTTGNHYQCDLTADFLSRDGKLIEPNRGYLRGQAEVAAAPSNLRASPPPLMRDGWQAVEYAQQGGKFYLGPALRACRSVRTEQGILWGKIIPAMVQELAGPRRSATDWIIPSAALDACLYAVGLLAWMQVQPGASLPFRFGRVALGRLPWPGEACLVECRFLRKEGRYADFDFTLFGVGGDVILQVTDYRIVYLG